MNILLNLISIKSGGGQQVVSNFINTLLSNNYFGHSFVFIVTEETYIKELLKNEKNIIIVPSNFILRYIYENYLIREIVKYNDYDIDIIYSLFGTTLKIKKIPSVVGCAFSNIFYPEINFWTSQNYLDLLIKKYIDYYRKRKTLNADAIVFENESMRQRAISLFKYPHEKTIFIRPSVSFHLNTSKDLITIKEKCSKLPKGYNLLMLTGWHKNKNIEIVPFILRILKSYASDFNFIITVSLNHPQSIGLFDEAKRQEVENNIYFFDSIEPYEVETLINSVDAVVLLSLLESFSNNIIEAWAYKKPLIISDKEWSRSICNDAALYVDRINPQDIADKINLLRNNISYSEILVKNGIEELKKYPTPIEKVNLQINFLYKVLVDYEKDV